VKDREIADMCKFSSYSYGAVSFSSPPFDDGTIQSDSDSA